MSLGYTLMYRAAANDEARTKLEEWMTLDADELVVLQAQRRRDAVLAMGGRIGGAP